MGEKPALRVLESAVIRVINDRFLGERRGMALYEENLPSRPNQEKNQDRASDDVITGFLSKPTRSRADSDTGPGRPLVGAGDVGECAPASRGIRAATHHIASGSAASWPSPGSGRLPRRACTQYFITREQANHEPRESYRSAQGLKAYSPGSSDVDGFGPAWSVLEDRTMLAAYTVISNADTNTGNPAIRDRYLTVGHQSAR